MPVLPRADSVIYYRVLALMKPLSLLLGLSLLISLSASGDDARRRHPIWYSPNSGISVIVLAGGSSGNRFLPPRFEEIPLSVYTTAGRFVSAMTPTPDPFDPAMTANVKPGDYIVVPDDPDLLDFARPVTVYFKEFTAVGIHIPPQ